MREASEMAQWVIGLVTRVESPEPTWRWIKRTQQRFLLTSAYMQEGEHLVPPSPLVCTDTQLHIFKRKHLKVRWAKNPCGQAHLFLKWQLDRYFKQFKWTHSLRNCLEDARYWFIRERTLFPQILQGYLENGKWLTAIHMPWKTSQLSPPHLDSVVFCPLKKRRERGGLKRHGPKEHQPHSRGQKGNQDCKKGPGRPALSGRRRL